MQSLRGQLLAIDWKKIGVGALVALGGALATYLQDTIPSIDFGTWTPVAVVINSVIVNTLRKLLTTTTYQ